MNLAAILELGNRTRLIVLGRLAAVMPSEQHDLLRLHMSAIGVIDFDQGSISLDAVLYDSRLAGKFPVTGSMAMRVNWGSKRVLALSIGGFHPAFKPPPALPALERLAITFSNSSDFRLRAEQYFAITANTLQIGARVELYRPRRRLRHHRTARLRRPHPVRPVRVRRRLQRLGAAHVPLEEPLQGVRRRRAVRPAPAARPRQGDVRDLLVRHLGAVRQDARSPASGRPSCRR